MRIYIAGPMTGIADFNRPAFNEAATKLRAMGHEVFNPAEQLDHELEPQSHLVRRLALAQDLLWLCIRAELLLLLPGWKGSSGAKAEVALSYAINLPTEELAWFLEKQHACIPES